jgi:hypothetical protein
VLVFGVALCFLAVCADSIVLLLTALVFVVLLVVPLADSLYFAWLQVSLMSLAWLQVVSMPVPLVWLQVSLLPMMF